MDASGTTIDLWIMSSTCGISILLTGCLKVWVESRLITNMNFLAFFGFSFILFYAYLWGSNFLHWSTINHTVVALHASPLTYAIVAVSTMLCHAMDRGLVRARFLIWPTPADFLQTMAAKGEKKFTDA